MKTLVDIMVENNIRNDTNYAFGTDKEFNHRYCSSFYDAEFLKYKDKEIKLLEIGIHRGGSLAVFNEYFSKATIVGVDPTDFGAAGKTAHLNRVSVIQKNGYTQEFVDSQPNFDIIIDDGPHTKESHIECLKLFLSKLNLGGVLVIEDIAQMEWTEDYKNLVPDHMEYEVIDAREVSQMSDSIMFVVRNKPSISFMHLASAGKKKSTEVIVDRIRQVYPNAYYFLGSDGVDDLSDIAKKYNTDYKFYEDRLGYPSYSGEKIVKWLERLKYACENCNTSHILMVEDDVLVLKNITVGAEWEIAGHPAGNPIPDFVIDLVEKVSGKRPAISGYGAGGGTMFKVSTILDNFDFVCDFFKEHGDNIRNRYEPVGFMDCYMVLFYWLCQKDYLVNPYLVDTHTHRNGYDFDDFVRKQSEDIEIVNNYKKHYW